MHVLHLVQVLADLIIVHALTPVELVKRVC